MKCRMPSFVPAKEIPGGRSTAFGTSLDVVQVSVPGSF